MNINALRVLRAQITRYSILAVRFAFAGRPLDAAESRTMAERFKRLLARVRATFTLIPFYAERAS